MVRINGCSTNLYDPTYHMGKLIEVDMTDESKWTVTATTSNQNVDRIWYTDIEVVWRPRKSVLQYLYNHYQRRHRQATFGLLKVRSAKYTESNINCNTFLFAFSSTNVDLEEQCLSVQVRVKTRRLHYGRIMQTDTTALPTQEVFIILTCPYFNEGIVNHMRPSAYWRDMYDTGTLTSIPYVRKWTMHCYISSDRNVYNLAKINNRIAGYAPLSVTYDKHVDYHRVRLFQTNAE